jgi:hypothetical protein
MQTIIENVALDAIAVLALASLLIAGLVWHKSKNQQQPPPAAPIQPAPTIQGPSVKSGFTLNMLIANAHQIATQIISVQLSIANLLAISVSALSIVAGTITFAAMRFPGNWLLWLVAGLIGVGLAVLIEGLTLGALIRIRLSSNKIKAIDTAVEAEREQIDVTKLTQQQHKTVLKELRRKRQYRTRSLRRMRFWSCPIAFVGSIASAVAGGLFYHTVFIDLGTWESLGIAALFPFVVTCNFISAELFKDMQEEAIRQGFTGGGLSEAALKEETRRLLFQSVQHDLLSGMKDSDVQQ